MAVSLCRIKVQSNKSCWPSSVSKKVMRILLDFCGLRKGKLWQWITNKVGKGGKGGQKRWQKFVVSERKKNTSEFEWNFTQKFIVISEFCNYAAIYNNPIISCSPSASAPQPLNFNININLTRKFQQVKAICTSF